MMTATTARTGGGICSHNSAGIGGACCILLCTYLNCHGASSSRCERLRLPRPAPLASNECFLGSDLQF
jgi:hypothetical protein